jgi:Tol biopolymer transport system component
VAGRTTRVSVSGTGEQADGGSFFGVSISVDGRYVAFLSEATNLVPADTNGQWDVFVRDRWAATTNRVTVSSTGVEGNGPSAGGPEAISADGQRVTFESVASNLVPGDTNGVNDIFVRIRGESLRTSGEQDTPAR